MSNKIVQCKKFRKILIKQKIWTYLRNKNRRKKQPRYKTSKSTLRTKSASRVSNAHVNAYKSIYVLSNRLKSKHNFIWLLSYLLSLRGQKLKEKLYFLPCRIKCPVKTKMKYFDILMFN